MDIPFFSSAAQPASTPPSQPVDRAHNIPPPLLTGAAPSSPLHHLNPRSCVTCRRRKVKCDKREPCGNCRKAHIECIFPAPGRAPRRPRKPPDSELMARLRKLEGVVQSLGQNPDGEHHPSPGAQSDRPGSEHSGGPNTAEQERHNHAADWAVDHHRSSLDKSFGRLVMNEGRTRYVNNTFWASLNNEVEDLKTLLTDNSDDDGNEPVSPSTSSPFTPQSQGNHQGFLFQFSSTAVDMSSLHPNPKLLMEFWRIYEEYCDPLVKMFHRPSMREQVEKVKGHPSAATKSMEAMLFSIYFASVTSMTQEECMEVAGESKADLLARYRFGVEQALARANLLVTEELITVQAMILFLLCLRRHDDAKIIWALSGLLLRVAISMGLHRDGSHFGLSPFDTEIRRRTWWQICVLDVRTSEDHGCDPTIIQSTFDTKFPLNVSDDELWPSMPTPPTERVGVTELTFCMIRFEVAVTFRRLAYRPDHEDPDSVTLHDKERWIEQCHSNLEEKYLRYCDMNTPMHWVICTVARLILAKMWLIIYHEFQREDGGKSLPQDIKDRLFITSLESITYALALETEVQTVKWGWLFKTYAQWHALAYLLSELCNRTTGPTVARAWQTVDAAVCEWGSKITNPQKTHLWKPLRKLLQRARAARAQGLASGQTAPKSEDVGMVAATLPASGDTPEFGVNAATDFFGDIPQSPMSTSTFPLTDPKSSTGFANGTTFVNLTPSEGSSGTAMDSLSAPGFGGFDIPASPFFANQPPMQQDRFNFGESADNFLNTLYPDAGGNGNSTGQPPASFDAGLGRHNFAAVNFNGKDDHGSAAEQMMKGRSSSAPDTQSQGSMDVGDPMVGGGGVNANANGDENAMHWETWDDIVREFQGGGNAWQQRPPLGETWL